MAVGSPPVRRDPRLRQPSRAAEPEEDRYDELSSDEEEGGGPADEEHPTSQYRGVSWNKTKQRWEVTMGACRVGKNKIFLGYFAYEDEEDAARMYDRGQIAYLGRDEASTNFPVQQYSHELDWLEGLGVLAFDALLKAARKQLTAADEEVTAEATLKVAKAGQGEPSSPNPQRGASDNAADEEIEIRKLAREGTPPRPPRPAAGQASRPKRSRPVPQDTPAAKRQKPAAAPVEKAEAAPAEAIAELRRELRVAEAMNEALVEKSAGLASFNAHLQVEVRDLRQLNASLLASNAQKDKQLQAQQEKLVALLLVDRPDLARLLSRAGAQ